MADVQEDPSKFKKMDMAGLYTNCSSLCRLAERMSQDAAPENKANSAMSFHSASHWVGDTICGIRCRMMHVTCLYIPHRFCCHYLYYCNYLKLTWKPFVFLLLLVLNNLHSSGRSVWHDARIESAFLDTDGLGTRRKSFSSLVTICVSLLCIMYIIVLYFSFLIPFFVTFIFYFFYWKRICRYKIGALR